MGDAKEASSFLDPGDETEEEQPQTAEPAEAGDETDEKQAQAVEPKEPSPELTRELKLSKTKSLSSVHSSGTSRDGGGVLDAIRAGKDYTRRMTPRSLEACSREGVAISELLMRPLHTFRGQAHENVPERHVKLRHERYEEARLGKLDIVAAMRDQLVEEGWPPSGEVQIAAAAESGMVDIWIR